MPSSRDRSLPGTPPPDDCLRAWRASALQGEGSPWLRADEARALAHYALSLGEGVSMMEAVATRFREPVSDISWEIIGADAAGDNWQDHKDPTRALELLQRKLRAAQEDGALLEYKLWLTKP